MSLSPVIVRLAAEHVGAAEVRDAVGVVETTGYLGLRESGGRQSRAPTAYLAIYLD